MVLARFLRKILMDLHRVCKADILLKSVGCTVYHEIDGEAMC